MFLKSQFRALLCRGRRKKVTSLVIIMIFLINAMFYVSLELYNLIKRRHKDPWYKSLHYDQNSYVDKTGMRVIVGHYVGGNSGGNLSEDVINSNHYAPVRGAGEGGRPVQLTPREIIPARDLYMLHSYNIVVSDRVSINRSLPDMRSERLMGARAATGNVLVFLDAHCEVTQGWIEPLLDRAGSDDVFVCPHIDLLSDDTLAYTKSIDAHWGAFSWRLHFRWLMPSHEVMMNKSKHPSRPYPTPAMAGGLFAVRKSLFWRLGGYDEGMIIWGAENLELSWRAWQCGARIEITPCSRVGHIFRRHSPYKYPGGVAKVLNSNLARAATVWMDEWADFFFKFNPSVAAIRDAQSVWNRVELRKRLNCKSFKWYLDNVWPQNFFPNEDRWFGRIRNDKGSCIGVVAGTPGLGGPASGINCGSDLDLDRLLVYTKDGKIMADEGLCLEQGNGRAVWKTCGDSKKQIWQQKGPRLKTVDGLCLTMVASDNKNGGDPLTAKRCMNESRQIWHFERVPWR